jgi:hypothetical protein
MVSRPLRSTGDSVFASGDMTSEEQEDDPHLEAEHQVCMQMQSCIKRKGKRTNEVLNAKRFLNFTRKRFKNDVQKNFDIVVHNVQKG